MSGKSWAIGAFQVTRCAWMTSHSCPTRVSLCSSFLFKNFSPLLTAVIREGCEAKSDHNLYSLVLRKLEHLLPVTTSNGSAFSFHYLSLLSMAVINTDQSQLGKKGAYFTLQVTSVIEGRQGRHLKQNPRVMLPAPLFPWLVQAAFSHHPGPPPPTSILHPENAPQTDLRLL